uniref:Protein Wnt n=1 Tax=Novocrania anomala TaxID=317945 RepID=A0A0U2LZI4_9BILA|nr:wnt1 [Novocrania anomala]
MKMNWCYIAILIVILLLGTLIEGKKNRLRGTKWWTLANTAPQENTLLNPNTVLYINPSLQPLTRKQRRLVTRNAGTILAIAKGARMAIQECKYQFNSRRWNCPTSDDSHGTSVFGKILQKGCRETAFIYSITSAAVSHAVARACAEGIIYTCTCDLKRHFPSGRDWEWGGCSDNAQFGHKFSRDFVDVVEKGRDLRYMMNRHNNEAGRMHVSTEMTRECKCHGMSGSCTVKTCWMRLPTFRKVGNYLKDRFDGSTRIYQGNSGRGRTRGKKFNILPVNPNHKSPEIKDLVYFEDSPSFCNPEPAIGFHGTMGRECNATSIGVDGCDLMCCGRGHTSKSYMAKERCSCTFHWCCKVHCEICTRTKMRHTCL